ncbi:hypothetical protein QEG98_17915 [Myxococcus sp. MxC21-1]|nr:hypothetical protein QEG98_17915 [Myxococcus sp. MxC21-1]
MGYVEVLNPAFPNAAPPTPVVHRGRRYALEDRRPTLARARRRRPVTRSTVDSTRAPASC